MVAHQRPTHGIGSRSARECNEDGADDQRDEWTAASDIGRSFGGVILTAEEYRRVEDAYVAVALDGAK